MCRGGRSVSRYLVDTMQGNGQRTACTTPARACYAHIVQHVVCGCVQVRVRVGDGVGIVHAGDALKHLKSQVAVPRIEITH